ncbi:MAG: methyltransferase domain-containing protein [Actinomycetota bacterium]
MASTAEPGRADLRRYYDAEAAGRLRPANGPRRQHLLSQFITLVQGEQRSMVLDLGAGPGRDLDGFTAAGLHAIGVDLAPANAVAAATESLMVVPGDVSAPPIRHRSFDAGWSMSTLMHLTDEPLAATAAGMGRLFVVGAPIWIGLWGGVRHGYDDHHTIDGESRHFAIRPASDNRRLLAGIGAVEGEEIWDVGPDNWEYQVFKLRVSDQIGVT